MNKTQPRNSPVCIIFHADFINTTLEAVRLAIGEYWSDKKSGVEIHIFMAGNNDMNAFSTFFRT